MQHDQREARQHHAAPTSSRLTVPTRSTSAAVMAAARRAAEARAAADEPEEPLGVARVVDVVRERPELADEQHAENQTEHVERDRNPAYPAVNSAQNDEQQRHAAGLCQRNRPAPAARAR